MIIQIMMTMVMIIQMIIQTMLMIQMMTMIQMIIQMMNISIFGEMCQKMNLMASGSAEAQYCRNEWNWREMKYYSNYLSL